MSVRAVLRREEGPTVLRMGKALDLLTFPIFAIPGVARDFP
ncbi:MAG TPA: hypothetical protein VKU80_00085 [Planctomycetota bacterium]|nr:hypothetical protein [Planctomycetota bacterium]